jgi:hypothetical protein
MLFKHEEVKVLTPGTFLTQIEDKEGREFWVKTTDLKEVKVIRPAKPRKIKKCGCTYAENTNFLDFLRDNATIRVQLPPQNISKFQEKYRQVTGEEIEAPSEHVSIIPAESKWGTAITVLFPIIGKPLVPASLATFSNGQTNPDVLGICNSDFAWELFSLGFRIGTKQKQTLIMEEANDEQQRQAGNS